MGSTTKTKARPRVRRALRKKVAQDECLAWLNKNHPRLSAEKNGDWVWITQEVLNHDGAWKSLAGYGFERKKRSPGYSVMESGGNGYWSHSCNHPTRHLFTKEKGHTTGKPKVLAKVEEETSASEDALMDELSSLLN